MSLACFECYKIGSFNTLIIFASDGKFDSEQQVSHFPNFYTDCATFSDFEAVTESRFMIVEDVDFHSQWSTDTGVGKLRETKCKLIDEKTLALKLPRIFAELLRRASAVPT